MSLFFAVLMCLIHLYTFYLESIAWGNPATNRLFRMSEADARAMKKMAFNQGFYNFFLAVALALGSLLRLSGRPLEGDTLLDYAALSVFGAGMVLLLSDRALKRPAMIQALPALAYGISRLFGI